MGRWRTPVTWTREHVDLAADGLLAAVLVAVSLLALKTATSVGVYPSGPFRPPNALGIALVVGQCLPVAVRRRHPLVALVVALGSFALSNKLGYRPVPAIGGVLIVVFSAPLYARSGRALAATAVVLALIGGANYLTLRSDPRYSEALLVWRLGVGGGAAVAGLAGRARRVYAERLEERAARLQRERAEAERALAEERARIARELHDVVTHHVTAMVVQADATQFRLDAGRDHLSSALASISTTGRQALTELRHLLGLLRPDGDGDGDGDGHGHGASRPVPSPTLDDLGALVKRVREAGQPVALRVEGPSVPVTAGVGASAYRVVQEALTNVVRHAEGEPAEVAVRYGADRLEVEVTNDGPLPAPASGRRPPAGYGLVGMRERVGHFGGELSAGPRPEGGFRVLARLPLEGGDS